MDQSTTANLVVNAPDDILSQTPSSSNAHGQSTVSKSVYKETTIVHLLSFDQSLESDDPGVESVSSGRWCFVVMNLNMAGLYIKKIYYYCKFTSSLHLTLLKQRIFIQTLMLIKMVIFTNLYQ